MVDEGEHEQLYEAGAWAVSVDYSHKHQAWIYANVHIHPHIDEAEFRRRVHPLIIGTVVRMERGQDYQE